VEAASPIRRTTFYKGLSRLDPRRLPFSLKTVLIATAPSASLFIKTADFTKDLLIAPPVARIGLEQTESFGFSLLFDDYDRPRFGGDRPVLHKALQDFLEAFRHPAFPLSHGLDAPGFLLAQVDDQKFSASLGIRFAHLFLSIDFASQL
jgi:hypothetical protein